MIVMVMVMVMVMIDDSDGNGGVVEQIAKACKPCKVGVCYWKVLCGDLAWSMKRNFKLKYGA